MKLGAIYVMRKLIKAPDKSETFHFSCCILRFMLVEPMGDVQNWMLFLVLQRDLVEASGDAAGACVDIQDEFPFKIRMNEYRTRREGLLE